MSDSWAILVPLVWFGGLLYVESVLRRFDKEKRFVRCPDGGEFALVRTDPPVSAALARQDLSINHCSLWTEWRHCSRSCLRRPRARVIQELFLVFGAQS